MSTQNREIEGSKTKMHGDTKMKELSLKEPSLRMLDCFCGMGGTQTLEKSDRRGVSSVVARRADFASHVLPLSIGVD